MGDEGGKKDQLKRKKQCKKFTSSETKDLRKEKITSDLEREIKKLHRPHLRSLSTKHPLRTSGGPRQVAAPDPWTCLPALPLL